MSKALNRKVTIYIDGKEVKSTLASLESEMRKLKAQQKDMTIGSEEYISTTKKIREINSVIESQRREVKGLGNEWKSTTTKVAEFANVVTGINSAFQMVDLGIGKLKDLAKAAAELDDVYADVMKTTGLTHDQVEKLNEAFSKMDTRTSREQLNQLAYEAGKLGISSEESIKGFVSAADKINIALGDVLGEGAMVTIGKLSGVYAKSTKQLADSAGDIEAQMLKIGSAINMLGQSSTANEQYLVEFLGRLGGVATQAGLSADQILGFASALDQDMQKLEMSATAFQRLIGEMIKRPEQFVKAAGVPLQEFQHMMETDMNGAIIRVLDGFNKMGGYTELMPLFKDMGLDGQRAAAAVSAMASSLDKVAEAQAIANRELTTGNSVINEFNVKNETMQAKAEKAKKKFEDMRIELGNELYPVLIHLQRTGTVLMKGVAGFVQLVKENKAILPGLIALMANWVRVKTLAFVANDKLRDRVKSLLGIEKLRAHQLDVQTAKTLKKVAAEEQEKLKSIQMQLAIEKENLARQQNSSLIEVQRLAAITRNKVYNLEVAATNQATVATNANTAAVKAQKAAFASTPWGLIITALTSIAGIVVGIVRNSEKWKLNQTLKEVAKQSGEAEGKVKVLFERLRDATAGSEEYKKALDELKAAYPDLIAKHVDEAGKIKDLTAAYNDLASAARQSVYDRMYADKVAEVQGELGEKLQKSMSEVGEFIDKVMKKQSEAERQYTKQLLNSVLKDITEGTISAHDAFQEMNGILNRATGKVLSTKWAVPGRVTELENATKRASKALNDLKINLQPTNNDPLGLQKKSLEELEAMLKEVNEAKKTASNVTELRELIAKSEAISAQIQKLKPKTETITTTVTGETEAERKAREKREKAQEKAEAAWTRFSNSYEQAMSKINAKTLTGIEAIGAEIDATTQKMRTDLEAIDKTAHPEAAKMLTDLEAATEAWKRTKIDEYIAKTNKEIDKLAKSTAKQGKTELDKVRKATEELNQKLRDVDATIAQLTIDREILAAKDDDKSKEQLANIDAQIARFKELRSLMVGAVFAEIAPTVKNPFLKQEQQMNSFSYAENRAKALAKVQEEIEKYTQALDEAIEAEKEMERVATANGSDEEAEKHRKATKELEKQKEAVEDVRKEAEKLAKTKAVNVTLDNWANAVEKFGSTALSIFSNITSILSNISQQHLQELEDQKDEEIKMLDDQLEQGLISQENYDKRKEELETEYREKAHEAELKDWRRQKAYGYSEAVINAAVAATKLWAGEGTTAYKIAMSALLAAEMATQIAAIASQPEPRAKGGYVESERLYRVGEAGREWIASNSLLTDPTTAPMIQALEAYQRGNRRALQMDQLNMPVVMQAARELGRRSTGSSDRFTASKGDDMLKVMKDLAKYLEDPKNRQVYISRQTQTDFDKNEDFLRNRASLG